MRRVFLILAAISVLKAAVLAQSTNGLVWDAMNKQIEVAPQTATAHLAFSVTNITGQEIVIQELRSSCACTTLEMPSLPWALAPGATGTIKVHSDIRGKYGTVTKNLYANSTAGAQRLQVKIIIPATNNEARRTRRQMAATADRQAVFRGECTSCHVTPTVGKMGQDLYEAACVICHQSVQRASMVTDLKIKAPGRSREYWRNWTRYSRQGTLMPAFAKSEGGPLSEDQIESLLDYLADSFAPNIQSK